jgi:hypothetical protein
MVLRRTRTNNDSRRKTIYKTAEFVNERKKEVKKKKMAAPPKSTDNSSYHPHPPWSKHPEEHGKECRF